MIQQILVVPDMHHPYADARVWGVILEVARRVKPAGCVIIGDFADFYSVSSHAKDPKRAADFESEVEATKSELSRLDRALGSRAWKHYCGGNHEDRLDRYIAAFAPKLHSYVSTQELLGLEARGWGWTPHGDWFTAGKCNFTHDVGRSGVNTARQSLVDFGGNIVVGHSHRGGVAYQGTVRGESHFALNVGWGGDYRAIDYVHRARALRDWQHGFGLVSLDARGFAWAEFVPIISGRCVVNGRQITGRKAPK